MADWKQLSLECRSVTHSLLRSFGSTFPNGLVLVSADASKVICGMVPLHLRDQPCKQCCYNGRCPVPSWLQTGLSPDKSPPATHPGPETEDTPGFVLAGLDKRYSDGTGKSPSLLGSLAAFLPLLWRDYQGTESVLSSQAVALMTADLISKLASRRPSCAEIEERLGRVLREQCGVSGWAGLLHDKSSYTITIPPSTELDDAALKALAGDVAAAVAKQDGDFVSVASDSETYALLTGLLRPPLEPGRVGDATALFAIPVLMDIDDEAEELSRFLAVLVAFSFADQPPSSVFDRIRLFGQLALAAWDDAYRITEAYREMRDVADERERLAGEMALAQKVQQTILPQTFPKVPGYSFAADSRPAKEVGGDFYDILPPDDAQRIALMIGDASGKGLKAAMFVTEAHGMAHAAAVSGRTPDRILSTINYAIASSRPESGEFVSIFCALLSPEDHWLLYSSGGHPPPILVRNGRVGEFELGGPVVGPLSNASFPLHVLELAVGDVIVMYTDGVTDAHNASGVLFGVGRLMAVVRAAAGGSAKAVLDAIFSALSAFTSGVDQFDDTTVLVLRRDK